ncbi:TrbG/VirB9 family P-type conjugative transfer protein [Sphingomonas sp. 3-13AW]|uniref:TrbG/VirB9 family P-type conjugative transfer protein n=1 Tax=Sphingomonas sp. 3-13AW TaxID=3050450 RepID=UPI003BB70C53
MKRILLAATALSILAVPGLAGAQTGSDKGGASPGRSTNVKSLGLTQDAWNDQLRTRGASRKRPGYVRYLYNKEDVFPIRTREGMITTIKLPEGVRVAQAFSGDDAGFQVGVPTPTTVAIKALYPGVDTSLVVFTEDDQVFNFYLRSEGYNSKTISDFLVDVALPGKGVMEAAVDEGFIATPSYGRPGARVADPATTAADVRDAYASSNPAEQGKDDYSDNYDFDPRTVVEDLTVYVPRKQVGGILPYKVFRDDRFTYIDYGPNASQIAEWPMVSLVIQGVETPVGFRTAGPGGRMIVVEALGDIVLRNGQRMLCIRKKGSVSAKDKELVEYNTAGQQQIRVPTDLPQGHGLLRSTQSKTVVPATPATVGREGNTKVVPLPQPKFTTPMPTTIRPQPGSRSTVDKPVTKPADVTFAPSPVTGRPGVTGAQIDKIAAQAPPPVVVRSAIKAVDIPASVVPAAGLAPAPAPASLAPAPASSALVPVAKAAAFAGYAVDLGVGDEAVLAAQWKQQKGKHATALNGKRVEYVAADNGQKRMRVVPISTVAEGADLCAELSAGGTACSVIANR